MTKDVGEAEVIRAAVNAWFVDEREDQATMWDSETDALTKALLDALQSSRTPVVDEWLPIETAKPIEFVDMLLLGRDRGNGGVLPCLWDGEQWRAITIAGLMPYANPTHWQPLPAPPTRITSSDNTEG